MPSGRPATPVPPHILRQVEQILAARNVGGMVPHGIAMDLLDEMAHAATRADGWSCDTYQTYGIHAFCHHCYP